MRIFNGCNFQINFVEGATFDPEVKAYVGGRVTRNIPVDKYLKAKMMYERIPGDVPIFTPIVKYLDPLPEDYDIVITTMFYAGAHGQTDDDRIYVVHNPVINFNKGGFKGVVGIKPYEVYTDLLDEDVNVNGFAE